MQNTIEHDCCNYFGERCVLYDDGDYPLLCSLEVVDEDGRVSKADMFTKQTIKEVYLFFRQKCKIGLLCLEGSLSGG